jgi:hypothetical protein
MRITLALFAVAVASQNHTPDAKLSKKLHSLSNHKEIKKLNILEIRI